MKQAKHSSQNSNLYAIILAGGSGTRLWPLSRKLLPKQFLVFEDNKTPMEATIGRVTRLVPQSNVVVVTNNLHAYGSAYTQLKPYRTLIEPQGRNTAPAIGLSAKYILSQGNPDAILVVMPSDHVIRREEAFIDALSLAVEEAERGRIVTLGIRPDRPDTGYGYIEADSGVPGCGARPAKHFVEKPDEATAKKYLEAGNYFWNAGIFVFKASVILDEMARHMPEVSRMMDRIAAESFKPDGIDYRAFNRMFPELPSISIDYGVMEKSSIVSVIPSDIGWSDVGSWISFYDVCPKDSKGNVVHGKTIALECSNSLLYSTERVISAIGVSDLAIVETGDALLVCPLSRSQQVKEVVDILSREKRPEATEHLTVRRPWGSYTLLDDGDNYKVKRLTIAPGQKISYQTHKHRAEHWTVISGTASIVMDGNELTLKPSQSIDIPVGAKHSLSNRGTATLEIVEVQSGQYLGEDDIVRLEDVYGRLQA